MDKILLQTPIEADEQDGYGKDITTFREYAQYMMYADPTYVEMSEETADAATDAVNRGLDIYEVYKSLRSDYKYDDDGHEYISFPEHDIAKRMLDNMLFQHTREQNKAGKRLYVAYGSNLNISQMTWRCPTAKLYGTGTIDGYELQFKGAPSGAFATIGQKDGASVPVAVWEIQPADEKSLDRYEGYPSHYYKEDVTVSMIIGEGEEAVPAEVTAMVYIMNQKMNFGVPSQKYYNAVYQGYENCGLDTDILNQAVEESIERYNALSQTQRQASLFGWDDDLQNETDYDEDDLTADEWDDEDDPLDMSGQMHL